jgi:hypothetical protein
MTTPNKAHYATNVAAWSVEQAKLLRGGDFDALDIEHIVEEIEDVGKSEQRELERRMALLLAELLRWQYQFARRDENWRRIIQEQRKALARRLGTVPGLLADLQNEEWWADAWGNALIASAGVAEIPFAELPHTCPWSEEQVFSVGFFPD